jgi:hypothetical protein
MMKCDNHPDRGGILFVDLPSIGVRRWGCLECRIAFDKQMLNWPSPRKASRDGAQIWEMHGGRSTMTDHAYHNPNAVYARAQTRNDNGSKDE